MAANDINTEISKKIAGATAIAYIYGRHDTGDKAAPRGDLLGRFARAYADHVANYERGKTNIMFAVGTAYDRWMNYGEI